VKKAYVQRKIFTLKKLCLSFLFSIAFVLFASAHTSSIYGLDCNGGAGGQGQLFSIDSNFSAFSPV
jgi:predicted tellurium resistance membrane protein TerC